jgi:hypothetical protein
MRQGDDRAERPQHSLDFAGELIGHESGEGEHDRNELRIAVPLQLLRHDAGQDGRVDLLVRRLNSKRLGTADQDKLLLEQLAVEDVLSGCWGDAIVFSGE